jgi:AraC family transcriptional regulator of adaptative response/methylated-DNA-[protein]-cysteine methyltransferase
MRGLCEFIREHSDSGDPLTLEVLGKRVGLSPSRLRRVFREIVGVTPRQFVEACRFEALKSGLRQGDDVTTSIYAAGFGSASRVYGRVDDRLGMTPGQYRAGGESLAITYVCGNTPIGRVLLAATDRGLCCVEIGDDDESLVVALRREYPRATLEARQAGDSEQLELWWRALERHLSGDEPHLDLPLDVRATAFQHRVWSYLQSIPFGETRSYSEVAEAIGRPRAVRAVAGACAANRAALVVPCHRVIRADGEPGGYRWGAERKRRLLEHEECRRSGDATA